MGQTAATAQSNLREKKNISVETGGPPKAVSRVVGFCVQTRFAIYLFRKGNWLDMRLLLLFA